jgi:hypothetical protein
LSKHHVTLVHHTPDAGIRVHQRTYEARNPHHALEQLREEISRDETMLAEIMAAHAVHHHVHREPRPHAAAA